LKTFDRLHPALQHHIVNSLGWRELRPLQEDGIEPILAGKHCLMIAPTAGGKTEAAVFPLLSRMLHENWCGLSVLYVCPLRALLNNLHVRLEYYTGLVGRTCSVWHGDVSDSMRDRIRKQPPDVLLTTPESIEAMFASPRTDHAAVFCNLQAVVVDEIHSFAGDDRGWHLLSLLERLVRIAGREMQRIGLSATVGNPEALMAWLAGRCAGESVVLKPASITTTDVDAQLDYVGSLENAATVISRLHRGEKRLVFVDSRSRVEELATYLRHQDVNTFVSHSSLSAEERRRSEAAFAEGRDCVIVATSSLELGIDVGDLDRVIQVDAPGTVASFLQRVGRTGRRAGMLRNCLFLATGDTALVHAAALIDLWKDGFVEAITPPPGPYSVFAQQVLGLLLQERQDGIHGWRDRLAWFADVRAVENADGDAILGHMRTEQILSDDQGVLWFGPRGEKLYGYRNFMDLTSVFTSPPLFCVKAGRREIGYVHESSFGPRKSGNVILLAGKAWLVTRVEWTRRVAFVEPTELHGRSRWMGMGPALSYEVCQSMARVLASEAEDSRWSRRAKETMKLARSQYPWARPESVAINHDTSGKTQLWTFGGMAANRTVAIWLQHHLGLEVAADNLYLTASGYVDIRTLRTLPQITEAALLDCIEPSVYEEWIDHVKFSECLPPDIKKSFFLHRQLSTSLAQRVLSSLRVSSETAH